MAGTITIVFSATAGTEGPVSDDLGDVAGTRAVRSHLGLLRVEAERRHGRVTQAAGGGLVAEFSTVYEAARAAVAMQQAASLAERQGPATALGLRIGVHVGDMADEDDDNLRETVALARQLCTGASPGQILASEIARMLIGNRPDVRFRPVEPVEFEGTAGPIVASEMLWEALSDPVVTRVIVADDSALIRSGVVRLLADSGFDVIAQASDYLSLVSAIDRDPPDLVVTDIRMPPDHRDEGLRAARYVKAHHPQVGVLILSQYVESSAAADLLDGQTAGVAYLLKERVSEIDDFIAVARQVASGGSVIDPIVTDQLLSKRRARVAVDPLSEREREVLALMAQGLSNQAISAALFLSAKTVETHIRSIFNKFDLPEETEGNRRVQAVVRWLDAQRG
jgi:DNA-binding NarL/FixJ family response regulator/class 3 adenylate cyclase